MARNFIKHLECWFMIYRNRTAINTVPCAYIFQTGKTKTANWSISASVYVELKETIASAQIKLQELGLQTHINTASF